MNKNIETPGTYPATITEAQLSTSKAGRAMLVIWCNVVEHEGEQPKQVRTQVMLEGDSTEKTIECIERARHLFDHAKADLNDLDVDVLNKPVRLVMEESVDPQYPGCRVKYVNRADGQRFRSKLNPLQASKLAQLNRLNAGLHSIDTAKPGTPVDKAANPISDKPQFKSADIPF